MSEYPIQEIRMYLSDTRIRKYCMKDKPLIENFISEEVREVKGEKVISYGLNANSYDIRLAEDARLFRNHHEYSLNPKRLEDGYLEPNFVHVNKTKFTGKDSAYIILPAKGFLLAHSVEKFNIPYNMTGFLYCKSTYARLGMNMAPTVLKSGWSGQLVLEIYNQTNNDLVLYVGEGIGTIYFAEHESDSELRYKGLYQGQHGITTARQ